jgi:LAO/AO transport system kinase
MSPKVEDLGGRAVFECNRIYKLKQLVMGRPLIIGIGGSHSGSGKTAIASMLLSALSSESRGPGAHRRWGAIKYTKTALYTSLTDDRATLDRKDKDTGKMLEAGAEEVLWIRGPGEGIKETVSMAIDRLSHLDGIIIEGNSAIEFSNPDVVIFTLGVRGEEMEKASALRLIKHADIIVFPRGSKPPADKNVYSARVAYFDPEDRKTGEELLACMDEVIEKHILDRIKHLLTAQAVDGRISCASARKIAEESKVPFGEVGKAANELKIKIRNCELGCF